MYFISFLAIISSITSLLRCGIADLRFIFCGIDVGIAGPVTADRVKFGIYAGQVVRDVQIYSAGEKPEIGEVVYEERDGRKVPVGKRYQYDTNSEGSNCWILVQWESVRDFETCIGY